MAEVRCEVSGGFRSSEAVAHLQDYIKRQHYIRVERDFLTEKEGQYFLPVGIVHVDPKTGAVLIELPHEAETGANRLWVHQDQLDERIEAFA